MKVMPAKLGFVTRLFGAMDEPNLSSYWIDGQTTIQCNDECCAKRYCARIGR